MGWGIFAFWLLSLGCSQHYNAKGLVFQDASSKRIPTKSLFMGTSEGKVLRLHLGDDSKYFEYLIGCGAEVEGLRVGRQLWVDSWTIVDAGDGSAPFLGVLIEKYGRLMMHDINTDTEVELLVDTLDVDIWSLMGKPILVTGIVVGQHQVRVMSVKLLSPQNDSLESDSSDEH